MIEFLKDFNPIVQALLAIGFTWGMTAVGAALVFVARDLSQRILDGTLGAAFALGLGIGLQNFPEGTAVSVPLRRQGVSRLKAFWYGQISAIVEPVVGAVGAGAVLLARPILPFALAFAAGAMMFVVVEELVPESQRAETRTWPPWAPCLAFQL